MAQLRLCCGCYGPRYSPAQHHRPQHTRDATAAACIVTSLLVPGCRYSGDNSYAQITNKAKYSVPAANSTYGWNGRLCSGNYRFMCEVRAPLASPARAVPMAAACLGAQMIDNEAWSGRTERQAEDCMQHMGAAQLLLSLQPLLVILHAAPAGDPTCSPCW
jgi:hypothetical protein